LNSKNKSETTWNIVKTITYNKNINNNISTMNIKDKLSSNPLGIAHAFNTYFSSVAENLLIKNFSVKNTVNNNYSISYLRQNFRRSFSTIQVGNTSMFEIEKIINSFKCTKFYGYDETSTRILKVSTPHILFPLTFIFNKILSTGTFPDRLKYSEVKPLKEIKQKFLNIGLFHFLQHLKKIIEKIIHQRLYCHLNNNNNNVLVNEQFGFWEKLSTEITTFTLLNKLLSSLDRKYFVGGSFCDLQKAFDCVNHDILLAKMEFYGISDVVNKLKRSFE